MSFVNGMSLLKAGEIQKAKTLLEEIIKANPDLFWKEFSYSMDLSHLKSVDITFKLWHELAKRFIQQSGLGGLDIAERLYSIMIQKENALELAINQAQDAAEKHCLEAIKEKTECSLARDYCQLGIVQMFKAAIKHEPELLAKAEENYLKAYREELQNPTPPTGRAWWNLASSVISRAQLHLINRDYLPSFLSGWLSLEMSLRWIWSTHVGSFEYEDRERDHVEDWDLNYVTHVLFQFGKLKKAQKEGLDVMRRMRNDIMHAKGVLPGPEDAQEVVHLATELLGFYRPEGTVYHLKILYSRKNS
jgi:tetratricopeptide (TPR) repeat protein